MQLLKVLWARLPVAAGTLWVFTTVPGLFGIHDMFPYLELVYL